MAAEAGSLAQGLDRPLVPLRFLNGDRVQRVALLHSVYDILPLLNLAKHGVLAIEPVGDNMRNEKLAAVGVGSGIGHRKGPDLVLVGIAPGFILEAVAGAAAAGGGRIAALNHEVIDDAMEHGSVVELLPRQEHKI